MARTKQTSVGAEKEAPKKKRTAKKATETKQDDLMMKPKEISPFDIIKFMFTDNEAFNKLTKLQLERNYFIINRIFSIKYPLQAQVFNQNGISQSEVLKIWKEFLNKIEGIGRVPSFCFTKGSKKSSEETTSARKKLTKARIIEYAKHYNLSLKELDDVYGFFPIEFEAEVDRFEKMMKDCAIITKAKSK